MAYSFLFWPNELPTISVIDDYAEDIPVSIIQIELQEGSSIQYSGNDPISFPVTAQYRIDREQAALLQEFARLANARSFWMPYPDPYAAFSMYDKETELAQYRYCKFSPANQSTLATMVPDGAGYFFVDLNLIFWTHVKSSNEIKIPGFPEQYRTYKPRK